MSVNLMGEFNLLIEIDRQVTYADVETAIRDAGFDDYTIVRQLGETATNAQITVRNNNGALDAEDTLSSLATAVAALDAAPGGGGGGS